MPVVAAAVAGAAAIALFAGTALARLGYPYALEWLESTSLIEVGRLLAGRPLYTPPTVDYVPAPYPPLYFAVSAAVSAAWPGVPGVSYLPLRLVSLAAALGCLAVLARLVSRETGDAVAGVAAAGLYAATYFAAGAWFDLARVDSLFLLFSLAGLYAARWMSGPAGAVAAGLLLAAAFLTKQSATAEAVAVVAALLAGPRRRLGALLAAVFAGVAGLTTLVWGLASDGWYVFYVFELLPQHALKPDAFGRFWTAHLLPALGLALGAALLGIRRAPPVIVLGCLALVAEGYAGLVHTGGAANNMMPAYAAVAALAGIGMATSGRRAGVGTETGGRRDAGTGTRGRRAGVAGALVLAQIAVLALTTFDPGRMTPGPDDRRTGDRLRDWLGTFDGPVAVFSDPGSAMAAGHSPVAHRGAMADVLRGKDRAARAALERSLARAVRERRFAAIVVQQPADLRALPDDLLRYYHRCPQRLLADVPRGVFRPVGGGPGRPSQLWLPVGRGFCSEIAARLG